MGGAWVPGQRTLHATSTCNVCFNNPVPPTRPGLAAQHAWPAAPPSRPAAPATFWQLSNRVYRGFGVSLIADTLQASRSSFFGACTQLGLSLA